VASIALDVWTEDPDEAAAFRAYWELAEDGESWAQTVAAVRSEFGLAQREMQRIVQECGTAVIPSVRCPNCGDPAEVSSRSAYTDTIRRGNVLCTLCQYQAQQEREQAARERAAKRRAALEERFPIYADAPVVVGDLSLFEAVALHAMFSDPAVEDAGLTTPTGIWPKERRWAPETLRYDYERRLLHASPALISAHRDSHPDAFEYKDDAPTGAIYLGKVSYYLLGLEDELNARPAPVISELNRVFREGPWPEPWTRQYRELWEELALAQAAAYLDMKLGEHHLDMKQGDGTRAALADALATFSLGQVFNFIYRAAKDSAAYYQRGGVNKRQAANSTVGRITAAADRARANGWEIKSFGMPWNLPWSAIAETFFNKVMWQADMMQVPLAAAHPPAHAWPAPSAEESLTPPGASGSDHPDDSITDCDGCGQRIYGPGLCGECKRM
jgi:hypothetical protein